MQGIDIPDAITLILAIAGGVTVIGGAWAYIKKWIAESKGTKNSEVIQEHTDQLKSIDERLQKLEKANISQDKYTNAMCETMLALLDHSITGNSIDRLQAARDKMKSYLIHRGEE